MNEGERGKASVDSASFGSAGRFGNRSGRGGSVGRDGSVLAKVIYCSIQPTIVLTAWSVEGAWVSSSPPRREANGPGELEGDRRACWIRDSHLEFVSRGSPLLAARVKVNLREDVTRREERAVRQGLFARAQQVLLSLRALDLDQVAHGSCAVGTIWTDGVRKTVRKRSENETRRRRARRAIGEGGPQRVNATSPMPSDSTSTY